MSPSLSPQPDLFIFAGETSGDLHGAMLLEALLQKRPELSLIAVAGPKMRAYPLSSIVNMEEFQVMGFTDVFFSFPKLFFLFHKIKKAILQANPKVCLFIDYPGFNLRMERALRKAGYKGKLIHYICPTVWAWGKKRVGLMAENLDLLLTIFPFEKACFAKTPLKVEYVGNPLTQTISSYIPTSNWVELQGFDSQKRIISLFPGSRKAEIERNLPLQLKAAQKLFEKYPDLLFCLSVAQKNFEPLMQYLKSELFSGELHFINANENYDLMRASFFAIATSGTVTLELGLHTTPTIVTYAIRPLDRWIAQKVFKIDLPHYCIANIIENRTIFPELFGPYFTKEKLLFHAERFLTNKEEIEHCKRACLDLQKTLACKNPHEEVAATIENYLLLEGF